MGALGDDDLFVLGRVALSADRVDRLLFRASEKLADLLAPGSESDEMTFEPDEDNSVENGFYYGVGPSEF